MGTTLRLAASQSNLTAKRYQRKPAIGQCCNFSKAIGVNHYAIEMIERRPVDGAADGKPHHWSNKNQCLKHGHKSKTVSSAVANIIGIKTADPLKLMAHYRKAKTQNAPCVRFLILASTLSLRCWVKLSR